MDSNYYKLVENMYYKYNKIKFLKSYEFYDDYKMGRLVVNKDKIEENIVKLVLILSLTS